MFGSRTLWAVARLLIFVQPPRYATPAELSFWLEGALAALGRDGVDRIRLRPLRSASLHSSSTWGWMIELDCHSVEAACAAAGEGSGMLLLEHLRMLGIRVNVALVEEAD